MRDYIMKLRERLKVPKEYRAYSVELRVWQKFKSKGTVYHSMAEFESTSVETHGHSGVYNGKYFIISCDRIMPDEELQTILFTSNVKRFYDEFFKEEPLPKPNHYLRPGVYQPVQTVMGYKFEPVLIAENKSPVLNDDIGKVLNKEIDSFVKNQEIYDKFKLEYKRGILLYGPPGNGKTSFIKHFVKNRKNTITILARANDASMTLFLNEFLEDSINDKVLKIMVYEDIDGMDANMRSLFLNFLDGVSRMKKVLFIATTNFPEKLDIGLKKRPSRFDAILQIDLPNADSRRTLLERYFKDVSGKEISDAVKMTEGFSGAYFKELFILSKLKNLSLHNSIIELKGRFKFAEGVREPGMTKEKFNALVNCVEKLS